MGLFTSDSSDEGCTAHHYGEAYVDWDRSEVKETITNNETYVLEIIPDKVQSCQHEGCNEMKRYSGERFTVPLSALSKFNKRERVEQIEELIKEHDEEE
jgi:hypothetical protein